MTSPLASRKGAFRPSQLFIKLITVSVLSSIGIWMCPSPHFSRRNASSDAVVQHVSFLPSPLLDFSTNDTQNQALNNIRHCKSPEYNVPWPLSGYITSETSSLSCGLASNTPLTQFLKNLSKTLSQQYSQECRQAVKFGVAFGLQHASKLRPFQRKPHKCSFMFVLQDEMPTSTTVNTTKTLSWGFETLLFVPRHVLPYQSTRRNVKLLKLHGHLLFPFTKLLVWNDVKLKGKFFIPTSYFQQFVTGNPTACMAAVGLPTAVASFGRQVLNDPKHYIPQYQDHCDTVVASLSKRPNVTDSTFALLEQCRHYQQQEIETQRHFHRKNGKNDSTISLNRGMIDSAFIVWNQYPQYCRDWNAKLACTWSDEIQCGSDRDQIAFPYVLQQMNVRERDAVHVDNVQETLSLVVNDEFNHAVVNILPTNCHWYWRTFPKLCRV